VPLTSIGEDLPQVLNAWFKEAERLDSVYEVFFGTLYNTRAYPRSQFLSLMQAAESFHRTTKSGKYVRPEKYEEFRKEMVSAIPEEATPELKSKLYGTLKYGNEYSLNERIKEIVDSLPGREILKKNPTFAQDVVATRHYLTHLDERGKAKALHGADLEAANEDLRILLTSLFLTRLDIDLSAVFNATVSMISRRPEFLDIETNNS